MESQGAWVGLSRRWMTVIVVADLALTVAAAFMRAATHCRVYVVSLQSTTRTVQLLHRVIFTAAVSGLCLQPVL